MMSKERKFIAALSGGLMVFFLIALAYFAFNKPNFEDFIHSIILGQLIVFFLAVCSVFVFLVMPFVRRVSGSAQEINKIVLLSEANTIVDEFSLVNRTSVLIVKNDTVHISLGEEQIADECAVVNRVENCWYIERISNERSVGLRRAGEQFVYKLKPGVCYKMNLNDVFFIGNERLLIL